MTRIQHVDDLCEYTGHFGVYQASVLIFVLGINLFLSDALTMVFVGADMPHWCRVDQLVNLSFTQQKNIAIPYSEPGSSEYSSCQVYSLNYSAYNEAELLSWNRTLMVDENTQVVDCNQWTYDQSVFFSTIVSRFNLVCGKGVLVEVIITVSMAGAVFGSVSAGIIADRIGKRLAVVVFLTIQVIGMIGSSFSPIYELFVAARFFQGLGSMGVASTSYVFAIESIGPDYRAFAGGARHVAASLGSVLISLVALAIRNDILYQAVSMLPIAIFFSMPFIVSESLRWLIVKKRYDEAYKVLGHICDVNGTSYPADLDLSLLESDDEKSASCLILLRSPRLRLHTIIVHFMFFTSSLLGFSLSLNTGNLAGDIFVNMIISASMEIPGMFLIAFLLNVRSLGRRINCSATFLLPGLLCLLCILLTLLKYDVWVTGFAIAAKVIAYCNYSVVILYASEIYPTEVRNSAMGSSFMAASLAFVVAPYFGAPMADVWGPLPYLLLGIIAVASGVLVLLLPETLGRPLPDTIEQAEAESKNNPKFGGSTGLDNATMTAVEHVPQGTDQWF